MQKVKVMVSLALLACLVVNGSGTLSGTSTIQWSYTISDGANQRQVSSTYSKH